MWKSPRLNSMKKSKAGSKEAKFFCESCGSEVPRNARTCPACGKFFASVRCPKCGKTGTNDDFKNGCPSCGYAINPDTLYSSSSGGIIKYKNQNHSLKKNRNQFSSGRKKSHKNFSSQDSSLPLWVYIVSVTALIILIICLYSCL